MYRRHFLLDIIQIQENFQKQGENISVSNLLADITLKDAMNYISTAWDSVRQDTIRKSFERTLSLEEEEANQSFQGVSFEQVSNKVMDISCSIDDMLQPCPGLACPVIL